ncbi:hypothetical protein AB0N89_02335 [Amycolatopsis sp. NPDC089917]|uniref:hypothetical protein n=1 Tax=Amycolatopsis sp. NPDC089917 TaxID=3155187 RepID=UPI0034126E74
MIVQLSVRSANTDDDLVALQQVRAAVAEGEPGGAFETISAGADSGGVGIEIDASRIKDIDALVKRIPDGIDGAA